MREQFPVEPLQFLPRTPRIAFEEGMRLLQEAGFEVRAGSHTTTQSQSHSITGACCCISSLYVRAYLP